MDVAPASSAEIGVGRIRGPEPNPDAYINRRKLTVTMIDMLICRAISARLRAPVPNDSPPAINITTSAKVIVAARNWQAST